MRDRRATHRLACLLLGCLLVAWPADAAKKKKSGRPAATSSSATAHPTPRSKHRVANRSAVQKASDEAAARYRRMVDAWHAPPALAAPRSAAGRQHLVLEVVNTGQRITLAPSHDDGGFVARDLDRLAIALRDQRTGNMFPVDPALIDLVYEVQRHFKAEAVRVISAYRTPRARSRSNHGRGRAIDVIVPGATDEAVAAFVRSHGFVGVGVYPLSGFVHIDVRPASYYWIDRSAPGQPKRERGVSASVARASDAAARAKGRKPHTAWAEPASEVDRVWRDGPGPAVSSPTGRPEEEDTDRNR